jgi:hypothetical protein
MCTKLQSAQIDKAKIGQEVKGIPITWLNYHKASNNDSDIAKEQKEFLNRILLEKHPYFFIYLYKGTKNKYKNHVNRYNITCQQKFSMSLSELINIKRKTKEQREFLNLFEKYSPIINSDCVMNNICKYIESVDFGIKNIINDSKNEEFYSFLLNNDVKFDNEKYEQVIDTYSKYKKMIHKLIPVTSKNESQRNGFDEGQDKMITGQYEKFKLKLNEICSNEDELVNYLIHLFYIDQPTSNKELLWKMYGENLYENIKENSSNSIYIPVPDEHGNINYLNNLYSLKEVQL